MHGYVADFAAVCLVAQYDVVWRFVGVVGGVAFCIFQIFKRVIIEALEALYLSDVSFKD